MYRSLALHAVHVRGAYGGSGVSGPNHCAVMIDVDVTATAALAGLHVTELEVLDAEGALLARAGGPIGLRILLPGRDADHNDITAPFAGIIDAGKTLRLRFFADFALAPYVRSERRYRATFATSDTTMTAFGPLDSPWATAGPAIL